jgi:hypothetical protein
MSVGLRREDATDQRELCTAWLVEPVDLPMDELYATGYNIEYIFPAKGRRTSVFYTNEFVSEMRAWALDNFCEGDVLVLTGKMAAVSLTMLAVSLAFPGYPLNVFLYEPHNQAYVLKVIQTEYDSNELPQGSGEGEG